MSDDPFGLDEPQEWDSGPYCQHWAEPWECDEKCVCGHECRQHGGSICSAEGCECEEFRDAEEDEVTT